MHSLLFVKLRTVYTINFIYLFIYLLTLFTALLLTAKVIQAEGKKMYILVFMVFRAISYHVLKENAKRTYNEQLYFTKKESVNVCFLHFDENCFEIDLKVYITIRFFSPVLSTY